jgi:diguanylate cyclase (GGDEF)-like protein
MVSLPTCTRFDELKLIDRLPTPTGVALALMRLAESDRSTVAEISRALDADPEMVGRVLKLANSASSGMTRPATTVREAVVRLGVRTVRNVALGFWLVSQAGGRACRQFDYERFWQNSLATAVAAQALAHHRGQVSPDEAFTCGLLGRVGQLALATILPEEYGDILERCQGEEPSWQRQQEREAFATDHGELTAALLQHWGLPAAYAAAVRVNVSPSDAAAAEGPAVREFAGALEFATRLAAVFTAAEDERPARLPDLLSAGKAVALDEAALFTLGDRVAGDWRLWGELLKVPTQPLPPFAELASRSQPAAPDATEVLDPGLVRPAALRVLVISADAAEKQALTRQLRAAGHTALAVDDEDAPRAVLEDAPQLLLIDAVAKPAGGLALCRKLRQTRVGRELYVVAVVGSERQADGAFEAGADDCVLRQALPGALVARLRAAGRLIRLQEETTRDKDELRRCAAELAVANRRLQHAAFEDPLTGLPNRRFALDRLAQEWARVSRTGQPLACILADLDHFKRINDTHGHEAGDEVLRATAEVMRAALRASDVVCRLGGEEFLILCPDTDLAGALACAERVRTRVEANRIRAAGFEGGVTVSLGVASREKGQGRPDDLLRAADRAVYQAKRLGRNRSVG